MWLKQSTAATVKIGPFLDEDDGKTAETGLTLTQADIRLSKNGGNMAQKNESSSCTHDELGYYDCDLDATDTGTLGRLKLMVHESGAQPIWHDFEVVPANVWDSMFGADYLQVDVTQVNGESNLSEMSQAQPPTTPTPAEAIMYPYMALRNKGDVTASVKEFHNDAGTVIWKKALTHDGTTYSEAKGATGP